MIESIRPSHLLQTCPSWCVSLGEPRPLEPRGPCLQHGLDKSSAFHTWEISALYSLLAIVRNDISSPGFLVIAVSIPSPFDQPRTSWSWPPGCSSHQRSRRSWWRCRGWWRRGYPTRKSLLDGHLRVAFWWGKLCFIPNVSFTRNDSQKICVPKSCRINRRFAVFLAFISSRFWNDHRWVLVAKLCWIS